jgi:glycosyltransferase involved in cell wall biosynthesis
VARQQAARGHDVHVITATRPLPHMTPEATEHGVTVHRITARVPFDLPIHPFAKRLIAERLEALKPDVVHIHMGAVSQFAWAGIAAASSLKIPSLTTVHSMWAAWTRVMYSVLRIINRWDSKTQLAAVSHAAAELVAKATSYEVLVTVNGVDLDAWRGGLDVTTAHQQIRLASATRFSPRKRVMQLLRMMKELHDQYGERTPHLSIAGNGSQFIEAQQFVSKNQLEAVITLSGRLDRESLKDLFAHSDAFIQLSELEAFGLAAIEARAVGLPVLGRADNGFSEFVEHGVSGYLETSDAGVKARIVELMQNPQRLAQLKSDSVAQPPLQDWNYALTQVENCYQRAISRLR